MGAEEFVSPLSVPVQLAIGEVFAGVTTEHAAYVHGCSVAELEAALMVPEARLIEPASDWDAVDLLASEFRETPEVLTGLIPIGVTLLSAAPKVGKTRLLAQVSVAVARGQTFLDREVTRTSVLVLALEDGARRVRGRLAALVGNDWPERGRLRVRTTSKRLDDGGITALEEHLDRQPECRLVIIDVLERVRPEGRGTNAYRLDYQALAPLQVMANVRGVAVVVVHHTNQRADVGDIFEKIGGTSGLIGVVDSLLLLQRRNGDTVGTLSVAGREIENQTLALGFESGWWCPAPEGMPPDLLDESAETRALWLWLAEHDGASTTELASQYGRSENTTLKHLRRLEERQLVDALGTPAKGRPVCWEVVRWRRA